MPDPMNPRTIVAVTGEDDRYEAVRSRAGSLAADTGARVILYDVDAASPLESPVPTEWSGEGAQDLISERLGPDELDAQGRGPLAEQVRGLRSVGVDAYGWLPQSADGGDIARYAESQDADLILVPAELEHPGPLERLTGKSADAAREETAIPVVTV